MAVPGASNAELCSIRGIGLGALLLLVGTAGPVTLFTLGDISASILAALSAPAVLVSALAVWRIRQLEVRVQFLRRAVDNENQCLKTAVNSMSDGLVLFDASGRILVCNSSYLTMFGLSAEFVKPGLHVRDLLRFRHSNGAFLGDVDAYCTRLFEELAQGRTTEILQEADHARLIRTRNRPLSQGGWVATFEDITDRRAVERERDRDRQFLQHIVDNVPVVIAVKDAADRRYVLVNRAAEALWGFSREEALGRTARELFPSEQADLIEYFDDAALASERPLTLDAHQNMARCGDTRVVTSKRLALRDKGGRPEYLVSVVEDVTERRRAEVDRDRNRDFLNLIINNVPTAIAVREAASGRYLLVNQAGEDYFGLALEEIVGKTVRDVWPAETASIIEQHDQNLLDGGGPSYIDEHPLQALTSGTRFVTSKRLITHDDQGKPEYLIGVIDDVTERRRSTEHIAHLAHYDSLTDLPNRVLLRQVLDQAIHRGEQLALLYIDLDHFKTVNDTFGHSMGDEFLKAAATRLRSCLDETDLIARLGGDEFAIVQHGTSDRDDVTALVARLYKAIREPHEVLRHQLVSDASIGIAMAPRDGADADELLKNADLAMYAAKSDRRGTYRFFEPSMEARVKERLRLELDLREAVATNAFELHYQPIVRLSDYMIVGCEALIRWRHPSRGMMSPATFIPLAEETGLILPIGELVLRTACAAAAKWPEDIRIAVNVSPVQFRAGQFVEMVAHALAASGLPASRLELEITEAVLIRDDEAALSALHRLRELGVRIAMDDFGTGYSSLSYLHRFPFDKIKIDQSFIKDFPDSSSSLAIVQALLHIARSRDMIVTAEGVETEQQAMSLRTVGCGEMQGHFFSRPLPPKEISALLNSYEHESTSAAS